VRRIEIVIDEFVLRGLTPEEARAAAAALEARLAALADAGAVAGARDEAFGRLPPVEAGSPAALGDAVAGVVWDAVAEGRGR
jgi:hypothetical protein